MKTLTAKNFIVSSATLCGTLLSLNVAICAPDRPLEVTAEVTDVTEVTEATQQNNVQTCEDVDSTCTQQETETVDARVAALAATKPVTPIYTYVDGDDVRYYDEDIQREIYRQWSEFDGILPDYELVLSLWITESGLNPYATNYNTDGTVDMGIPQINTVTIQEAYAKGWMAYEDDIYNLDTQIHVGLCVLNYYCENCPGGDYPYYRAIRAYGLGVDGLNYAESIGDYGQYDEWRQGPNNMWYPGKYGVIMETAKYLYQDVDTY